MLIIPTLRDIFIKFVARDENNVFLCLNSACCDKQKKQLILIYNIKSVSHAAIPVALRLGSTKRRCDRLKCHVAFNKLSINRIASLAKLLSSPIVAKQRTSCCVGSAIAPLFFAHLLHGIRFYRVKFVTLCQNPKFSSCRS